MAITESGFQRQTYDEILAAQIVRAKQLFGDNIDTSEQSVFGKFLRLYCLDAETNQEIAEGAYLSAFPNSANGVSLDRLCVLAGISRNTATHALQNITITGTVGATIEIGFLVASGDVVFHTMADYTIGADGTVEALVECDDAGTVGNVAIGSITEIVNPSADVTSITHTSAEELASDTETDYSLRSRMSQSILGEGSGTVDSIQAAVMRVSGVETVVIVENSTNSTVDGVPAHSFQTYVLAPSSAGQSIAEAIFSKKPIGITSYGTSSYNVSDISGGTHSISFSFAEELPIYIKCTISTNSSYSSASLQEIKDNLVSKLAAYTNGQSVTASSMYASTFVTGVDDVTSLTIGTTSAGCSTTTITPTMSQVARTYEAYIEVTVE